MSENDELQQLYIENKQMEDELANIENQFRKIRDGSLQINEDNVTPDLDKLQTDNRKLKYQIDCLKRSIAAEEDKSAGAPVKKVYIKSDKNMSSIQTELIQLFEEAVNKAYPGVSVSVSLTPGTQEKFGDYQCNNAMAIAQILKPEKIAPKTIAEKIINNVSENSLIDKMEIAGAGFINIFLCKEYISKILLNIAQAGIKPPYLGSKKKVVIDMSSPNIAKEMHVGHLRSTIIGESIARLESFVGHDVLKLNHLGDWGTQFGMLIAHLMDKFPNYLKVSPPIGDLQSFYKESKKRFDEDEVFKKRAYQSVVLLQSNDQNHIKAWNLICNESRKEFTKIYERLEIKNLVDRGESFYHNLMPLVIEELESKHLLEIDDGRKIMWPLTTTVPLTIIKSDGGFTYDTSDMAAIKHRLEVEKADEVLYVVDQGQSVHFNAIFECAAKAGWFNTSKVRCEHIGFGVVLGEDKKKFKTRSGDTVRLVDLLDEGIKRAESKLKEKGRDQVLTDQEFDAAKKAVAYGCIKYADLSHCRINDYVFSFDKMLDDKGNTAVYLQYAYMRIRSIIRQTGLSDKEIQQQISSLSCISLDHGKEWKLAKLICRFSDVILRCVDDLMIHNLCDYLYELATTFTEFYDSCYVVEKDKNTGTILKIDFSRLSICESAAKIMQQGFAILGLNTVEKM